MVLPIPIADEVLKEKAEIFAEELLNWSPETIQAAFRDFARTSKYQPALTDIIERCRSCSQSLEYKRQAKALPMPSELSEEVRARNLAHLREIKRRLFAKNII